MASSSKFNNDPTQYTFYRVHVTKNSDSCTMVASMDDDHLRATIAMMLTNVKQIMSFSGSGIAALDPMSQMIIGKMHKDLISTAQNKLPYVLATLNAYMSEAVFIRNMVDLIPEYQKAIGRTGQLPFFLVDNDDQNLLGDGDYSDYNMRG